MSILSFIAKNPHQTQKLGEILAGEVLKNKTKKAAIIGLEGNLGGGKTTFLQGFAKGLGIKEKVLSPTFIIMRKFSIFPAAYLKKIQKAGSRQRRGNSQFSNFYHIDCYRIQNPKEILLLGFKKIISNPENVVAVEWPEKIKKFFPKSAVTLKFEFLDNKTRKITIKTGKA